VGKYRFASPAHSCNTVKNLIWLLIVLLVILHQDDWFWLDGTLVWGFIPIGLFYHACLSLAAGIVWYLATRYCWPRNLEKHRVDEAVDRRP